jgi:hypothetical protein
MMTSEAQPRVAGSPPINMVDAEEPGQDGPTEETSLLDTDSEQQNNETDNDSSGDKTPKGQNWEGYDDFKGLPWWRTPTVCIQIENAVVESSHINEI